MDILYKKLWFITCNGNYIFNPHSAEMVRETEGQMDRNFSSLSSVLGIYLFSGRYCLQPILVFPLLGNYVRGAKTNT